MEKRIINLAFAREMIPLNLKSMKSFTSMLPSSHCYASSPVYQNRYPQPLFISFPGGGFPSLVLGFPRAPGNISVLDHVLYLALHRNRKEDKEVQYKNGPKDRDVKSAEKGHKEGGHSASCAR